MTVDPKPGQWVVIARGPGEAAMVADVIAASARDILLGRSPFRTLRPLIVAAFDGINDAHELASAINHQANAPHLAAMERARGEQAERWKATVARLVERFSARNAAYDALQPDGPPHGMQG